MSFNKDFVWGAATASYQVEGAAFEDGKGLNIWDVFSSEEGHVYEGHTGETGCDQYHRYKEDVQLMKEMGIRAYRFSLSWSRILPEGTGKVNEAGVDYYNRLIDALLEAGIEPYVTLYHWDLPYALHLQGGWMNPASPEWFYEYAALCAQRFSDRVRFFFTLNEPQCILALGYGNGEHAPGLKTGPNDYFRIWYNLLKVHGRGVQALRENQKQPLQVGMASCGGLFSPAGENAADVEAARRATFGLMDDSLFSAAWDVAFWADPLFFGRYPEDVQEKFGKYLPAITEEDRAVITQPLDFFGMNMYNCVPVRADEKGDPVRVKRYDGFPRTANGWPVTPEVTYWGPKFLYERYKKPVYVTENGLSCHDWVSVDGKVHDPGREDFLRRYLKELKKGISDGTDVRGYFAWSLLDNFEWSAGYKERFGLIYVDYRTGERIRKDSSRLYQQIIAENGENL